MNNKLISGLIACGVNSSEVEHHAKYITDLIASHTPINAWQTLTQLFLANEKNFALHCFLFHYVFDETPQNYFTHPVWYSCESCKKHSNIMNIMQTLSLDTYEKFQQWAHKNYADFWALMLKTLEIQLGSPYSKIADMTNGIEKITWLPDAKMNIIDSCFTANNDAIAVIAYAENQQIKQWTYQELAMLVNRIAHSLVTIGVQPHDNIAIDMSMTYEAVAIFLAIVKVGATVVTIADSFAPDEISTRLRIAPCQLLFTHDVILRSGKTLPLYQKIVSANGPKTVVLPITENKIQETLRPGDLAWHDFLLAETKFQAYKNNPEDFSTILFSSGTTGDPKAIPWTHTTPIKCASDAHLHFDVKPNDRLIWPTNLGWMMGPWLIYAALINKATIALYYGSPTEKNFGQFVQDANINILGLVPSIVSSWRQTNCMEDFSWQHIKLFASSGECSNPEDMMYLMFLAQYKPIIEYCGGTEIGGAYITNTILHDNIPSTFTTPALGLDFVILNEAGSPCDNGELAIIPPSIGLSTTLLNRDHHKIYYADMPDYQQQILRRHGDQVIRLAQHCYQALGRVDDTMNLGAIKTSSADIERVLFGINNVKDVAAIATNPPGGGPSLLVIYVVPVFAEKMNVAELKTAMQQKIRDHLNPLFKIHDVVCVEQLPRTASNKIMRRVLRNEYESRGRS